MKFMMLVCLDPTRFETDEAVRVAAHPVAATGKIEVRPFWP